MSNNSNVNADAVKSLFEAGAHFGYTKVRRHPSVAPYIFGAKNRVEIFDLEKTLPTLETAKAFVKSIAESGKPLLFIGGKHEARQAIQSVAERLGQPYVAGRFIGGTITNFSEIKKRIAKLEKRLSEREKGELSKYTKKERLMIDREIETLEETFGGLVGLKEKPAAVFVVDSGKEHIAVSEAKQAGIPVVSISGSDCDVSKIAYPIIANDASRKSIAYILEEVAKSFEEGAEVRKATK